jgi:hypothetical protein
MNKFTETFKSYQEMSGEDKVKTELLDSYEFTYNPVEFPDPINLFFVDGIITFKGGLNTINKRQFQDLSMNVTFCSLITKGEITDIELPEESPEESTEETIEEVLVDDE